MKQFMIFVAVAVSAGLLLSACGKKEESPQVPPTPVVVKPTPPAPATPTPAPAPVPPVVKETQKTVVDLVSSAKGGIEKAMALAKDGKYQEALALLQQKAGEVQSNPEAKKLIDDAVVKIKQMMADATTKAATQKLGDAAGKTIGGLGK